MSKNVAGFNPDSPLIFQAWREGFLRIILRGAVIFGLVALIPTLLTNTYELFFVLYGIIYVALLVAAFSPLSYEARAWIFIGLFFLLGVSGLFDTGIWGDSRVFFVFMTAVTAMLISPRAAIWITIISIIATALAGWLILTGRISLSTKEISPGNMATWLSGIAVILMLDAIMIIGLSLLQNEMTRAQGQAEKSLDELRAEQALLEDRVETRTREYLHKSNQLETASSIARKISRIRDLQTLLDDIVLTIADQFKLYHAGIFLFDESTQNVILMAASSDGGKQLVAEGYRLKIGNEGMVSHVINQARPRLALDVGTDALFTYHPKLPKTRSELTLPLISRDKVIGALDLQSDEQKGFTEADLEIFQTLADQLATAIENARLFSERESVIEQLEAVSALQVPKAWSSFLQGRNPTAYQYTRTGVQAGSATSLGSSSKRIRLPLSLRGREIGSITLGRKEAGSDWSVRDLEMAQEITSQVVLALENARLLEETTRRADMERLTSEITTRINTSTLYESIIQTAAEQLSQALGGSEVLVQLQGLQSGSGTIETVKHRGREE